MRQSAAIRMLTLPYAGLDQFNRSPIPRSLAGRGEVLLMMFADPALRLHQTHDYCCARWNTKKNTITVREPKA